MSILVVLVKEVLDNLRDRQTVFYALLFGPVLLPLLIGGSLVASLKQLSIDFEEVTRLAVVGEQKAPRLMDFLYSRNVDTGPAPADYADRLRSGKLAVVLRIEPGYGDALRQGEPAPLTLLHNAGDKESAREARRISALLGAYERLNDNLRMQHRGIDPAVFDTLDLVEVDVSDDGVSGQLFASMLPFLFIVSMTMGGFYLAVDTTAGERERQSLEPLISLPLRRRDLVLGKFAATLCFVALSAVLTAISIYLLFRLVPQDLTGGRLRFDGPAIALALAVASPLMPMLAAVLISVSACTRSTKQAQTYLGLLMVIPMAPFFILQFINTSHHVVTGVLPMLSQYQLLERVVLGEPLDSTTLVLSVVGTLACAALFLWLAVRLYEREALLQ